MPEVNKDDHERAILAGDGSRRVAQALLTAIDVASTASPILADTPAQRILLALFVAGQYVDQASIIPVDLKPTAGSRWIAYLADKGLVERNDSQSQITDDGRRLVHNTLLRIMQAQAALT